MKYVVTAKEMKQYDENTISRTGIPAMVLMERAALGGLEEIEAYFKQNSLANKNVLIFVGRGNNGADGLALARLLCVKDYNVEVVLIDSKTGVTEQWEAQNSILQKYPVKIGSKPGEREYTILVDAIFGVGLSKNVTGKYAEFIKLFNQMNGFKIALDLPSGLDSDCGRIMGVSTKVDITVTFGFAKRGLYLNDGRDCGGKIVVKEIGIDQQSFYGNTPQLFRYDESPKDVLPPRTTSGNKGGFGKVLLIAGNKNMAGAAALAAKSAYRIGAGMVKIISWECNREILQTSVPEALYGTEEDLDQSLEWANVIAIGPGLGMDVSAKLFLEKVLTECSLPLVIDADGLNLLSQDTRLIEILKREGQKGRDIILTPHIGEFSRLSNLGLDEIKNNPEQHTKELAECWNCVIVNKDARTFICKSGVPSCINITGNSGMATAGSGDVLTGIIVGLLAQGVSAFEAAGIGVYLHGSAGDMATSYFGEHGIMAGDLIEMLTQLNE